ncbi:hypothetical protein TUN199_05920 [Pyrenophora tritici-repentis]|nr:hypothetical protein Alg215_07035 [Pyrenophora tritici-repentis]KAI0580279.1 hypothetical protein Alg130_07123 [Pyrenophora tritici-repentis]KAI0610119.1 hypothetical protein TUN205_05626 [Pyrenophora tritici-repentis]KAI0622080.1 hypothetical protein TUN199_05920 [Pyrenophora tritici-repentis]
MNNDHQGARVYLIHTAQHPRPFLTTVPFVARDFAAWGYRVDHHAADSAYIVEVRAREKMQHMRRKARSASRRTKLMEIWAHEVLERKRGERGNVSMTTPAEEVDTGFGAIEARVKKAGDVVQDFINGVAALGNGKNVSMRHSQQTIATKYTRLLYAVRYNPNTPLPAWSNPDIVYADQVILEFSHHEAIQKEHLVHAVSSAIGKNEGRMGRVEKCTRTGVKRVLLWVDVGDVLMGAAGFVEEGEVDPVPKYERGEGPPVYVKG